MGAKNRNVAALWQNNCGALMVNKLQTKIGWIAAIGLLIVALLCMVFVGDRVVAALFNLWKFSGYHHWQGIDLGARSSFQFLMVCLYGLTGCFALIILCKPQGGTSFSRIVIAAGSIYFIDGSLLLLTISSGLGYLYCGR